MKKALSLSLAVVLASMVFTMLAGPADPAVAQGRPEDPGRPTEGGSTAVLGPSFNSLLAGSCEIDCGNGDDPVTTDAGSTIECACDCARICDSECTATNSETGETRSCEAN